MKERNNSDPAVKQGEDLFERCVALEACVAKLEKLRDLHETMLAALSEVHLVIDPDGRLLYINNFAAEALKSRPQDMLGKILYDFMPEQLASTRRQVVQQAIKTKSTVRSIDQPHEKSFDSLVQPQIDSNGRVCQLVVIARDITDSHKSQKQLLEREELLQATMESTADGILVVDEAGKVVLANARFAELWLVPEDILESRDDDKLLAFVLDQLADPQAFLDKVKELYNSTAESFDTLLFKDGRVFERFSCALRRDNENVGRVWSFRDASHHKQATSDLKDTLSRYRSLFDDAPIAMFELDLSKLKNFITQLRLTDAAVLRAYFQARPETIEQCISLMEVGDLNPRCLALYQASNRAEFISKFRETFSPEMLDALIDGLAAMARGNTLWKTETSIFTCLGNRRDVILKVSICPGYEATLAKALISVVDISDRKTAENALRGSETMLRTVINATQDAMISIDEAGLITLFNPAAEKMFGRSRDEVSGQPLDILMPEEYRQGHSDYVRSFFATDKPNAAIGKIVELPAIRADGEIFPIEISLSAGDSEGKRFVIAVLRDITERRRTQEVLAESEQRFRDLVEHAGVGIVVTDLNGRFTFANETSAKLLGYSLKEFEEMGLDAVVHPDDLEWVQDNHRRRCLGEEVPARYELRAIKKDGSPVYLDISVGVLHEDGKVIGNRTYLLDITELKQIEEALRRSDERFQSFSETVTDVIYRYDVQRDRFDFVSPSCATQTGYSPTEFEANPGKVLRRITHPDDLDRVTRQFEAHLAKGPDAGTWHIEYRVIRKDGCVIWVSEFRDLEFAEDGELLCINGVVRDITIQKLREQERLQLESQMQQAQKMESLGVLAGGIAHEFNNMLGGILGTAELMLSDLPTDSQLRKDIEQIMAAAGRAAHLTEQMLAYSGKGAFVVKPLDLSRVVREMSELLRTATPKGVQINFDLAAELPPTVADLSQIRQIVINLVSNAAEAMTAEGGTIHCSTGVLEADSEYMKETVAGAEIPAGSYVYFEVSDEGSGMETTTIARMFEPFFTTKFAGRGLGLAAVDGIVRGHNGTIRIESSPDQGTNIRVLLPVATATERIEGGDQADDSEYQRGSILVADAEETTCYLARRILQRAGYRVIQAADLEEASLLLATDELQIQLAMFDTFLPHGSKGNLHSQLEALPHTLPIILSSSDPADEDEVEKSGTRFQGFVRKPYRPQELLETVQRLLSRRHEAQLDYTL